MRQCPETETVAEVTGGWYEYDPNSQTYEADENITVSYKRPEWPSAEAEALIQNPQLRLADRFPQLIDSIVDEVSRDLKPAADAKILDDVTRLARQFSDEVGNVDLWRKEFTPNGIAICMIESDRVSALAENIILSFSGRTMAMLRELLHTRVHAVVHRTSVVESCADKRRELIARKQELDRATQGMWRILGIDSEAERQKLSSNILSSTQASMILLWLKEVVAGRGDHPKMTLLYRASRDGWGSSHFHSKCDNKGPTLTVIKCTGGYVFGGYANAAWTSNKDGDH